MISRSVPKSLRRSVRHALLGMRDSTEGRTILTSALLSRFTIAADRDYDAIRLMAVEAHSVTFQP